MFFFFLGGTSGDCFQGFPGFFYVVSGGFCVV